MTGQRVGTTTRRSAIAGAGAAVLACGVITAAVGTQAASATPTTVSFGPGVHHLQVPAGPVDISFVLVGGGGGASGPGQAASLPGGHGGYVSETLRWIGTTPGTITVNVGYAGGQVGGQIHNLGGARNGGRGGGYFPFPQASVLGHGGNGGSGGNAGPLNIYMPGGGGGGGASSLVAAGTIFLVVGGGGGGSSNGAGGDAIGFGADRPHSCYPGGVGKTGNIKQVGGGGGGGGAINGNGGGGALPGGGGSYTESNGFYQHVLLEPPFSIGTTGYGAYGQPGTNGFAQFTGEGISGS